MDYRCLGPVEASTGGATLKIGGPRQQIVLSLLLSATGRVVPVHNLVDAIWGDSPPATARSQVHICVSGLRRQLGAGDDRPVIETRAPGYALPMGPADTSDLVLFDELVETGLGAGAAGDPETAAADLHAALELWRGDPFGGLGAGSAPLRDLAAALWERRSMVGSSLIEFEFALGHHAEVINELRREVDRDPLAERTRGQLMVALHGAGRQAEALREYRIARELLVEELGIEPGPELREVERRILAGDLPAAAVRDERVAPSRRSTVPAPAAPESDPPEPGVRLRAERTERPVPRLLPPGVADFTGRQTELDVLLSGLSADAADPAAPAPVAVVVGSAGVGKSTLAVQAAWRLTEHFPDGQLYADLHGGRRGGDLGVLERFLRALGTPDNAIPENAEERLALYRQLLSERRVLVVLDDAASEDEIRPLLPGAGTCAVLVTSRRRLTGIPGVLTVELARFRPDESVELLSQVLGHDRVRADPDGAAKLVEFCDNLPLAVRIAAARLAARPHWSPTEIADRLSTGSPLDELHYGELAVRDSVLLTYDQLDPPVRRLFRMIGLFDAPDFGEWLARPLHDDERDRYPEDMLAVLVEMHLLDVTVVDGVPRYAMHDLVRAAARERAADEDPTEERFAALHRAFRALLGLLDAAHRSAYGGDYLVVRGDTERHPVRERDLAEVTRSPLAWHAREARFIAAAVARSATMELPGLAWELALRAVVGFEASHDLDSWRDTHAAARIAVETHGDRLGRAAIDYSLGSLAVLTHDLDRADELLAAAAAGFDELGRPEDTALAQRNQAYVELQRGDLARVSELAEPALRTFRRTGDLLGEAYALRLLASRNTALGDVTTAVDQLEYAVTLCRRVGNRRMAAQVLHRLGLARLAMGELQVGAEIFIRVLSLVRETGDTVGETHALLGGAAAARRQGAVADAAEMLARAEEIALAADDRRVQALILLERGRVLAEDGHHGGAVGVLDSAAEAFRALALPLSEAEALMELGDVHRRRGESTAARRRWSSALAVVGTLPRSAGGRLQRELMGRTEAPSIMG